MKKKVSVALGREEFEWASKRAKREKRSVSAVLTDAVREAREEEAKRNRQLAAWTEVRDWALGGQPLTPEELEAARRELEGE